MGNETNLHTLIPLVNFKAILGVDDREDALSRYCLVTATFTIEQYCKRRLFRKKHTDYLTFSGDHIFTLREYPVRKILSVYAADSGAVLAGQPLFEGENLVNPEHYYCLPEPSTDDEGGGSPLDEGIHEDIPFSLVLRPPLRLSCGERAIRVRYAAGYVPGKVPPDLASACLELAAWNMSRYRGRRIGLTGAVRGKGADGEHLELSMPENVRGLLEPYKRRTI
ncbi:MAG: hypothetical protein LBQ88_01205 [Treponema sp.]|jgi:hypothetical protein|nr:hypothetical protein [Treponema sp.]